MFATPGTKQTISELEARAEHAEATLNAIRNSMAVIEFTPDGMAPYRTSMTVFWMWSVTSAMK